MSEEHEIARLVNGAISPRPIPDEFRASDLGNAERLIARHGHELRFAPGIGWLAWDGSRWARDATGEVTRRMGETIRSLYVEADLLQDEDRRKLIRFALVSERESRLRGAIALAESIAGVVVMPDELDADPTVFNILNGSIDLKTGELRAHNRADLITRVAPIEFDPDAECPHWLGFLERIFDGDRALIDFVQRAVGYSLTGTTSEQVLLILHGSGANGKTTLIETLRALFGDYGTQTPASTFLERRGDGIPNDLARLRGARLVSGAETPEGRRLDEVLIKRLTGGDTITARYLHKEYFEYRPAFTPWVATNHRPVVKGTDDALWRRLRLVPFGVTIPEGERDHRLVDKLAEELPGILAWAVAGCLAWQRDGLNAPPAVLAATSSYRAESDVFVDFLEERCLVGEGLQVPKKELYTAYTDWCDSSGIPKGERLSRTTFGRSLADRGFKDGRTKSARYWLGVGLLVEEGP